MGHGVILFCGAQHRLLGGFKSINHLLGCPKVARIDRRSFISSSRRPPKSKQSLQTNMPKELLLKMCPRLISFQSILQYLRYARSTSSSGSSCPALSFHLISRGLRIRTLSYGYWKEKIKIPYGGMMLLEEAALVKNARKYKFLYL